jgi:glycosyltransferase involved in cell wall biosynthesis
MLLEGRWEYKKLGILDKTHVKFYTEHSAVKMFEESNFQVSKIGKVKLDSQTVAQMSDITLNEDLIKVVESINPEDESGRVFQYIFLAEKKEENCRVVVYTPMKDLALFDIRIKIPLNEWAEKHHGMIRYRSFNEIKVDDLHWGEVFIFQRLGTDYVYQLIEILKSHGKKVIFEIDDLLIDLPEFLKHHHMSKANLLALEKVIGSADCVSTTTQRLSEELQKLNKNVVCTPNYATHTHRVRQNYHYNSEEKTNLIIASSDQVLMDFIVPALLKLQQEQGEKFNIIVIGPPGDYLENAGLKVIKQSMLPYNDFWNFIQNIVNPIAIIPLDSSLFSSCKSPIKYFDYASAGIPVICSCVPPYSDVVTSNVNGLLVENTTEDWVNKITALLDSIQMRLELISKANLYLKSNFTKEFTTHQWNQLFLGLHVKRIDNPELLKPQTFITPKTSIKFINNSVIVIQKFRLGRIIKLGINPQNYLKAIQILKNRGLKGLMESLHKIN